VFYRFRASGQVFGVLDGRRIEFGGHHIQGLPHDFEKVQDC
jgi:hypothetical protein